MDMGRKKMKTNKDYKENLKKGIITKEMLIKCLYSSNKRAKNYRDKEREYRDKARYNYYWYDKYNNIDKCESKKEEYYKQKEDMLSILKPTCIHKEFKYYEKRRIKEFEDDYKKNIQNAVWKNSYYDQELGREIRFIDIELKEKPIYFYYLYFDVGMDVSFHKPIKEEEIDKYEKEGLEIKEIDELITEGKEITELISNQFVVKLIELIKSGKYKYIENR